MEVSRNALESVLDFVATDGSRECLKHVKVSADGNTIIAADGFALAIAPIKNGEDVAGKLLNGDSLRSLIKGAGTRGRDSQEINISPHADGIHAAAKCGTFTALIPFVDATFPNTNELVERYPLSDRSENSGAFAISAHYLTTIAKAAKRFSYVVRIYPGPSKTEPSWFTFEYTTEAPEVSVLVMPMTVVWPGKAMEG